MLLRHRDGLTAAQAEIGLKPPHTAGGQDCGGASVVKARASASRISISASLLSLSGAATLAVSSGAAGLGASTAKPWIEAYDANGALVARALVRLGGHFITDVPLAVIAVGLGIMLAISAGKPEITRE